ncbi:MAG: RNA polymerase [Acidimicrobiaceae bacterium]|nr:RNA polymerase [Acidimicrobiaceae bacterium]
MARHSARREARFDGLFRAHYSSVEAFVRGQFPHADLAEVMSSTFATAWRRLDDIRVEAERGWLIGVANNTALNSIRGRRRRDARDEAYRTITFRGPAELHDHDVPPETLEHLSVAFERLSASDREIIQLAAFDGLTGADLGAALGVSPGTAAVRLHRARQRFSEHYRKQDQP